MCSNEIIRIRMFGEFVITWKDVDYHMTRYLNKQPLNLLQLLLLDHHQVVSNENLYDALWNDSKNPKSALKFTIHSLRASLNEIFHDDIIWITSCKGGYQINPKLNIQLDTDEFSNIVKQLENKHEFVQKDYQIALKIMDIYSSHLFMTSSQYFWINQLSEWYRTNFANIVGRICKYLINRGEYEQMIKLDYQAILREPFYEGLHYFYIQGLIKTQEYHKALQYYGEINEAFYKELGTGLSPRFKELYNILEAENNVEELSLAVIQQELDDYKNRQEENGGFYCTFDMFKHVYELSQQVAKRESFDYYMILFNIVGNTSVDKKSQAANRLRDMILHSIRSSDICARINDYQFILLVHCMTEEDTQIIVSRITQRFYSVYPSHRYRLNYSVGKVKTKKD